MSDGSVLTDDYHLGTSDQELERLAYQHLVWQDVSAALWREAGFGRGQTLLDLGCGPGLAAMDLARLATSEGRVHAVDSSEKFVNHLRSMADAAGLGHIDAQVGDVHRIDLPANSVDGIFARWLLCFVSDPRRVLAEAARLLRPGGRLVTWDYFNYRSTGLFPQRASVVRLFEAYHQSAILNGGSYEISEHIPSLMAELGLELTAIEPICRIARPGSRLWEWVSLFHDSYLPKLLAQGLLEPDEAAAFGEDWRAAQSDPASFFFTPPMLGIIAGKPK
jgi:SAM-dependent methyltransferase